jgi:AcrR family transcriptional regulator
MEEKKTDKRKAIMKAAMELIAEHGFHGAPTAMIAEKANVAIGSIYRYFENKDALIIELHQEIENAAMKEITLGYDMTRPLRERYFHVAKKMLQYMIGHPLEFRFVEQFFDSPYGMAMRRDRFFSETAINDNADILKELYEHGTSQQIIKDCELPIFFSLAFGNLFNIARDHIIGFIKLDDYKMDMIVGACWDAVKL